MSASRLVLLGAPGAGKGTQASGLAGRLGVLHVESGDILRGSARAGTSLGRESMRYMDAGELVPDEAVLEIVVARLREPDVAKGFILDGFPRTCAQAEALDAALATLGRPLERVVQLVVPEEELLERIARRGDLTRRPDDREGVATNRLRVYHAETEPLVGYYRARGLLAPVDGVGTVDEVTSRILETLT